MLLACTLVYPFVGLARAAVSPGAAGRRLRRAHAARRHVRVVRALRVVAHRQPGPGRLPDGDAAAAPLAALVERGGERDRHLAACCTRSRFSITSSPSRSASSTCATSSTSCSWRRCLRLGHAPGAGGAAVARPALTPRGQWPAWCWRSRRCSRSSSSGRAMLDARSWRLDLTPERRYTLSEHARQVLGGLDRDVRVLAFLRSQDSRNPMIRDLLRQVRAVAPRVRVRHRRRQPQPGARAGVRRRLLRRAGGGERGTAARVLESARGDPGGGGAAGDPPAAQDGRLGASGTARATSREQRPATGATPPRAPSSSRSTTRSCRSRCSATRCRSAPPCW